MQAKNSFPYLPCPLTLLILTIFCPSPLTISGTNIFFNSGEILSKGIYLLVFPFPLPLPFDLDAAAAAVSLDLGLTLALSAILQPIAFARSSLWDLLGIWYDSRHVQPVKIDLLVMSLEDGMEASMSGHTKGQEEKSPNRPPQGTVVEACMRMRELVFLTRLLWRSV